MCRHPSVQPRPSIAAPVAVLHGGIRTPHRSGGRQRRRNKSARRRITKAQSSVRAVGVLRDFSGTSGCINGYERETAERSFVQVSDVHRPIAAGYGVGLASSATSDQTGSALLPSFSGVQTRTTFNARSDSAKLPDTPSERASNERHERHFSVKISPVTPTPHIMRTENTAGQEPFVTRLRIATHST